MDNNEINTQEINNNDVATATERSNRTDLEVLIEFFAGMAWID